MTLKYGVELDTRSAERSLNSLKNAITGFGASIAGAFATKEIVALTARFEDLRTSLQILYKSAGTGSAVFDDIKKFAASSVFSVEDLTQTIIKLKAAGLEPTVALLRMFADVSSVATDKVGTLQAITDLYARTTAGGLGLEDLNRLADRGIPVFTILSDTLGISRLEISKLGQSAEGAKIILQALEAGLQKQFGGSTSARADSLTQSISNLKDTFSNLSDALGQSGLNKGLADFNKSLSDLLTKAQPLIEVLGAGLGKVFSFLAENIKPLVYGAGAFFAIMTVGRIVAIAKAFNLLNLVIGKGPIGLIARLAAAAGIALGLFQDGVDELKGEFDLLNDSMDKIPQNDGFKALQEGQLNTGTDGMRERLMALNEELNKFKVEMASVVSEFARYNKQTIDSINLETSLIGISTEIGRIRQAEADITSKATDEIIKLEQAKAKLTAEEKKQGRAAIIDEAINKIRQQAEVDKAATADAIKNSEARKAAFELEKFARSSQIDVEKQIRDVQFDIATSTMGEMEKKAAQITRDTWERANAEIKAQEAARNTLLTEEEKLKYYEAAKIKSKELIQVNEEAYNKSREFSTGWNNAFREYIDNAQNAAEQARNIFQKLTQGFEDLFVNFVKTGKFEWKNFLNMMVEELLRSQVRQLMANLFNASGMGTIGGGGGGGGLFGGKIIPGILADGGPVSANRPYIVGERGPELFLPDSGGKMIPNRDLGGSVVNYNINAVDAASFKAMIARDPSFIHAVAMQGAKSVPSRR